MITKRNYLNFILLIILFFGFVFGCSSSNESTDEWRKRQLKEQETVADLMKRGDEFAKFTAPEKLQNEGYVKAPVIIVWIGADGKTEIKENNINRIKDHAKSAVDAKSVFKIKCSGIPAGEYVFKDESKASVPAFSTRCETELFDKTIPALIYRKIFENKELKDSIKAGRITGKVPEKVVAPIPEKEIEDFIYFLPRK
jgi:hypothetical protein